MEAVFSVNEDDRLEDLERLEILDTPSERSFDRIVDVARMVFKVPVAYLSFVDRDRQWMKACHGIDLTEVPREHAFCHHTVQQPTPLIVQDTLLDPRFATNPYVIGEPKVRFYAGAPLVTKRGNSVGALCILDTEPHDLDVDQQALLASLAAMVVDDLELRQLASTDSLTGAMTRRAFDNTAARLVQKAKRKRLSTSFLLLDLDHFKTINDRFGHSAGDRVLVRTVEACRSVLRNYDCISRRGGEEFAILLDETPLRDAAQIAERLRASIASLEFEFAGTTFRISASIGVTQWSSADRTTSDVLDRADRALYSAKSSGRNRVAVEVSASSAEQSTTAA